MKKEQWDTIKAGNIAEVSEDDFEEMLDVLPPAYMHKTVKLMNGETVNSDYGFVEGADRVTAFFKRDGKFYAAGTTLFSRGN